MVTFPFIFTHLNISENLDILSKNSGLTQAPPVSVNSQFYEIFQNLFKCVFCARKKKPILPSMCGKTEMYNTD